MVRRVSAAVLIVSAPLMLAALLWGGEIASHLFALVSVLFPTALIVFASSSAHSRRRPVVIALLLAVVLLASTAAVLLLRPVTGEPAASGASIWMLAGFGLVPLVLMTVGYALAFGAPRAGEPD